MEENKDLIGKENYGEILNTDLRSGTETENNESGSEDIIPQVNVDLIRNYPKSNKRVPLYVDYYKVDSFLTDNCCIERSNTQSTHISPHGVEFKTEVKYNVGDLLKMDVFVPNYWNRKKKLVEYDYLSNIEPLSFKILGRVIERIQSGNKFLVTLETLVIDDLDREILTSFIKGTSV